MRSTVGLRLVVANLPLIFFLKSQALQHKKAGTSTTLVLPGEEKGDDNKLPIIAFFAASFTNIERSTLPEKIQKKLPHYPVPAFLIALLAINENAERARATAGSRS